MTDALMMAWWKAASGYGSYLPGSLDIEDPTLEVDGGESVNLRVRLGVRPRSPVRVAASVISPLSLQRDSTRDLTLTEDEEEGMFGTDFSPNAIGTFEFGGESFVELVGRDQYVSENTTRRRFSLVNGVLTLGELSTLVQGHENGAASIGNRVWVVQKGALTGILRLRAWDYDPDTGVMTQAPSGDVASFDPGRASFTTALIAMPDENRMWIVMSYGSGTITVQFLGFTHAAGVLTRSASDDFTYTFSGVGGYIQGGICVGNRMFAIQHDLVGFSNRPLPMVDVLDYTGGSLVRAATYDYAGELASGAVSGIMRLGNSVWIYIVKTAHPELYHLNLVNSLQLAPTALTFTNRNWDEYQSITVSTADIMDTPTINLAASGPAEYAGVTGSATVTVS